MDFPRDKLWALAGLMISALCLLLHVIAFALPEWTVVTLLGQTTKWGLWQTCSSDAVIESCLQISLKGLTASFRCVQAFACFALILLVVAVALSVLRIIKADDDRKKQFSLILACLHGAAAFCVMIAFAVWADKYLPGGKYGGPSFGLEIVCFILEMLAAVFMTLDVVQQNQPSAA